ncbi:membrane hypothetical protein [metagenome]|uniref:Glycosyltransferase RgtA/B/C/D-like domain-containing protein n=1 Tax=metagenome TaxID=256318 RepID=A0A2P2BZ56_9ZZZZ
MGTDTVLRAPRPSLPRRGWPVQPTAALVGLTLCLWIPVLSAPLTSDEGGFLLVAAQWHAGGTSLYGDYWVDRPPVLILIFALAHLCGGAVALRVLGCLCAVASILLSQAVGTRLTGNRAAGLAAALVTTALLATPLFDSFQVDGELVALPWVYAGLLAACSAYSRASVRASNRTMFRWAAAGALGAVAALIKQNVVDVVVFVALLLTCARLVGERSTRSVLTSAAAFTGGAAVVALATLALASTRDTTPPGLWDALVTFRAEAGRVIADSASPATHARFVGLALALASSGGAALGLLSLGLVLRRPARPARLAPPRRPWQRCWCGRASGSWVVAAIGCTTSSGWFPVSRSERRCWWPLRGGSAGPPGRPWATSRSQPWWASPSWACTLRPRSGRAP